MELWREKLRGDFEAFNLRTERVVASLSEDVKRNLPKVDCEQCAQKIYKGDVLQFPCSHNHCYDCISDRLERLRGMFEREQRVRLLNEYPALGNLVLCSKCHMPAIVQQEEVFQALLIQDKMGSQKRKVFTIETAVTQKLRADENTRVEACFENERRFVGKFSHENLLRIERGRYSTETGDAFDRKRMDDLQDLPNARQYEWLEAWKPDGQNNPCDTQGWQYARGWPPKERGAGFLWLGAPTWKTFIRRRKLLRARVKLAVLRDWKPRRDRSDTETDAAAARASAAATPTNSSRELETPRESEQASIDAA